MTEQEWKELSDRVTDAMLGFTRPFATPLTNETQTDIRLIGTGSYTWIGDRRSLVTCEHVARHQPLDYRFFGSDEVFRHPGPWRADPHPIDAAQALVPDQAWNAITHRAQAVPMGKFADRHRTAQKEELLFFMGFAGENAHYGFGAHEADGTGYCTQEVENSGDEQIFELFWRPDKTQFSSETNQKTRKRIKTENARGFSGSLVWNTRFLEISAQERTWTPDDAVVTGLLRRWDEDTETLLGWRVEHLNAWLRNP